jgi:hypothetical protein
MKGIVPLQGEIIAKEQKYTEFFFLDLLLQNQQAKFKLGTNYPWVKGIQVKG